MVTKKVTQPKVVTPPKTVIPPVPKTQYAGTLNISLAFIEANKGDVNLQKAWEAYKKGNFTDFEANFLGSDFYKNNNGTARQRLQAKAEQPAVYASELEAYKISSNKRLIAQGITLDDADLTKYAEQAYSKGMDDNQFDQLITTAHKTGTIGGSIGGDVQTLKSYANSFGVGNKQDWQRESENLFAGTTTVEDIKTKIRQDAISAYPAYADQLNKGISLDSLASAYKSTMASVLELDPDTISYSNPILAKALQSTDAQNKPSVTPLWQFERQLKQTKQWEYTDNARTTMDSMSLRVLKDMGLA